MEYVHYSTVSNKNDVFSIPLDFSDGPNYIYVCYIYEIDSTVTFNIDNKDEIYKVNVEVLPGNRNFSINTLSIDIYSQLDPEENKIKIEQEQFKIIQVKKKSMLKWKYWPVILNDDSTIKENSLNLINQNTKFIFSLVCKLNVDNIYQLYDASRCTFNPQYLTFTGLICNIKIDKYSLYKESEYFKELFTIDPNMEDLEILDYNNLVIIYVKKYAEDNTIPEFTHSFIEVMDFANEYKFHNLYYECEKILFNAIIYSKIPKKEVIKLKDNAEKYDLIVLSNKIKSLLCFFNSQWKQQEYIYSFKNKE